MDNENEQNILIVHNYYQIPGGEDTVVANEKKKLEDHGHKVILYSRNNLEIKQMLNLQKLLLPITTIFNTRTYREIKKLIQLEKIELVHVHNTLNLISPAVYDATRAMNVPVVQTVHNFRLLYPEATFYRDGHICEDCVQHGLKCAVKHNYYHGSKIKTLACVISTCFHRMTGIYGSINYICLTEFNKGKLLELKQIKPEKVFVKLNFVESKGGFVPNIEVRKLIANSRAFVLPTQWYGVFSMSIVEAFSVGTPVICSDLGNYGMIKKIYTRIFTGGYNVKQNTLCYNIENLHVLENCNARKQVTA